MLLDHVRREPHILLHVRRSFLRSKHGCHVFWQVPLLPLIPHGFPLCWHHRKNRHSKVLQKPDIPVFPLPLWPCDQVHSDPAQCLRQISPGGFPVSPQKSSWKFYPYLPKKRAHRIRHTECLTFQTRPESYRLLQIFHEGRERSHRFSDVHNVPRHHIHKSRSL